MNILYDSAMPYAAKFFEGLGNLQSFSAGELHASMLAETDILLVRSTTCIDKDCLQKAPRLKVVGTATAGFDHFDTQALDKAGIKWFAAPGCNARAVAEYICCALLARAQEADFTLADKSLGVIGVGEVGARVANLSRRLGMRVLQYDPPKSQREPQFCSDSFESVISADIVSLHVPLTKGGDFPTYKMISQKVIADLLPEQILINASRGDVVDSDALVKHLKTEQTKSFSALTDCWSGEPIINKELIHLSDIATAHIAGHTLEGKARGTESLYQQLCAFLGIEPSRQLVDFLPKMAANVHVESALTDIKKHGVTQQTLHALSKCFYNIREDESTFRTFMQSNESFSEYRRSYPVRREFDAISLAMNDASCANQLQTLGFSIEKN